MTNEEWQEFVEHLVDAKRRLAVAWSVLDGTVVEGRCSPAVCRAARETLCRPPRLRQASGGT